MPSKVWSNGRFRNAKHRVICKETATRYSFGAFMLASRDGNVEAPLELVNSDHPRLYHPFKYEDLRLFRITTGKRNGEVLDQYLLTKRRSLLQVLPEVPDTLVVEERPYLNGKL
ncbi:hypothetical protein VNO77_35072 [Canavalia gladiata]|uniref:Isopenicillin N synthase-like Fe(2+) 2OG dioxygenase domain-containing protein n=1 Tax=Canavalia gladiata TaxID=3824 RepID=A0AAN9PZI9_CANGL